MRIGILSAGLGLEDVYENKRLAREIRLKGHRPVLIDYHKTVLAIANKRRLLYQPDKKGVLQQIRVEAVIPRINEADEASINLASMALEALISGGAYSTATPESIRLAKSKIRTIMVLSAAGVPVPRTAAITGADVGEDIEIDKVLKVMEPNVKQRLIVKTNVGTKGRGVMSANNRGEARAIVDGFSANKVPVLLQQFIEPAQKNNYSDLRFVVVNGQVVGSMKRTSARKDEIRANISLGGHGEPYKPTESELEIAKNAAKAMGMAVAGVDIIPSGRHRYVIEVNTSPGFAIEKLTGVNIAKKVIQLAITNAKKNHKTKPQKVVDFLQSDIKVPKRKPLPKRRLQAIKDVKLFSRPKAAKRD